MQQYYKVLLFPYWSSRHSLKSVNRLDPNISFRILCSINFSLDKLKMLIWSSSPFLLVPWIFNTRNQKFEVIRLMIFATYVIRSSNKYNDEISYNQYASRDNYRVRLENPVLSRLYRALSTIVYDQCSRVKIHSICC